MEFNSSTYNANLAIFTNPVHQKAVLRRLKLYIVVSGLLTASTFLAIVSPFVNSTDVATMGSAPSPGPLREPGRPLSRNSQLSFFVRALCSISFVLSLSCISAAFAYIYIITNRSPSECKGILPPEDPAILLGHLEEREKIEMTQGLQVSGSAADILHSAADSSSRGSREDTQPADLEGGAGASAVPLKAEIDRTRKMKVAGHSIIKAIILLRNFTVLTLALSFAAVLAAVVLALATFVGRGAAIFALIVSGVALIVIVAANYSAYHSLDTLKEALGDHPKEDPESRAALQASG